MSTMIRLKVIFESYITESYISFGNITPFLLLSLFSQRMRNIYEEKTSQLEAVLAE